MPGDTNETGGSKVIDALFTGLMDYDPVSGADTEYELYDLVRDPLEMTNLAHAKHSTPASEAERARLHRRLWDVMCANGTRPDEIRWPEVDDYRPTTEMAETDEDDAASV